MIGSNNFKVSSCELTDIYEGTVEDTGDPEGLRRVRVRAVGLFDEPIKKEHLPWALPANDKVAQPQIGDVVFIFFRRGDIRRPLYL